MTPNRAFVFALAVAAALSTAVPSYADGGQSRGARAPSRAHRAPHVARPIAPIFRAPMYPYGPRRFGLGVRSGWRPGYSRFGTYGYDPFGYGSRYGMPAYGTPVVRTGGIRITDAPRDAGVYVDGYYAGAVDEFDGRFQRLQLEPGGYRIEIRTPGYGAETFDVNVQPGRTTTVRAGALRRGNP